MKKCKNCGDLFKPKTSGQCFCCADCWEEFHKKKVNKAMIDVRITERNLHKYCYDVDEIVKLLDSRRMSRKGFAKRIGLKADTFNRMISRRVQRIKLELLDRIAVELDVTMEQIVKRKAGYEPITIPHTDGAIVHKKTCPMCGEEFYTTKVQQKYCCSKCKDEEYRRRKNERMQKLR